MCKFCQMIRDKKYLYIDDKIVLMKDNYPVTEGHALIIPIRCIPTYFQLDSLELERVHIFISEYTKIMMEEDSTIEGWNIGWNCGKVAGQTIDHAHCHVIPRRKGDCEDPTGGVRHSACNGKGDYTK